MAFPKAGDGWDPMMDTPSEVSEKQLKELHIKVIKPKPHTKESLVRGKRKRNQ